MNIQNKIAKWLEETLEEERAAAGLSHEENIKERCDRFLEEAIELAQVIGLSKEVVHKRVDYVFNRPVGKIPEEIAGSMLTLYAVADICEIDADSVTLKELDRISTPEIREKIKNRQVEKRKAVK